MKTFVITEDSHNNSIASSEDEESRDNLYLPSSGWNLHGGREIDGDAAQLRSTEDTSSEVALGCF